MIIAIDKENKVQIYIDRAHAIHIDRKGYSGIFLMIGRGRMINISKKLELVTLSSTKTEVVTDMKYFLKYS